jgi:hypothetical protein
MLYVCGRSCAEHVCFVICRTCMLCYVLNLYVVCYRTWMLYAELGCIVIFRIWMVCYMLCNIQKLYGLLCHLHVWFVQNLQNLDVIFRSNMVCAELAEPGFNIQNL